MTIPFLHRAATVSTGYRMPAEWEPQDAVWLVPPHNHETWPGCFDRAAAQFERFRSELSAAVSVRTPAEHGIATNDSWIRDFGPLFVVRGPEAPEGPPLLIHDFVFNGWGNKYETRDSDDQVPTHLGAALGLPVLAHDFVLEGGSIEVNGAGTVLTTEQCVLNPNRPRACRPGTERALVEKTFAEALGAGHTVWLPGGIAGDDTDGHIDDVARFVGPDTVVCVSAASGHPDHPVTARNLEALRAARDQDGRRFEVIELPVPEPIFYDFPPDRFGPGGRGPVPASYANFLISNDHLFVPVFGQRTDDRALRTLEQANPGRRIVPVRSEWLVVGLGALHCLSMQQPAVGDAVGC